MSRLETAVPLVVIEPGRVANDSVHRIDHAGPPLKDARAIGIKTDNVSKSRDLLNGVNFLEKSDTMALSVALDRRREASEAGSDDDHFDPRRRELGKVRHCAGVGWA